MEAFVHPAEAEKSESYFLPCVGGRAGPSHSFISLAGPLAILAPRFVKGAAENFGAAMKKNRRIEGSGTPRERRALASTHSISRPGSTPSSVSPSNTTSTTSSISATTPGGQQRPVD